MRLAALLIGLVLVLGGLVWVAQGLGLAWAPRSFMTADRLWVLLGAIAVVVGGILVAWARAPGRGS